MAELINKTASSGRRGGLRCKKLSTRVDLTPMVDLGFLLITFFIFTTTMSHPHVTRLNMPANGDSTSLGRDAALTLVALADDKIFYYNGTMADALSTGNYGLAGYAMEDGIGEVIRQKQRRMDQSYKGGRKELMLLIKPSPEASYKNVVGLLDEMLINKVGRYAVMDIPAEEVRAVLAQSAAMRMEGSERSGQSGGR